MDSQDAWLRNLAGRFLVFDGPDGSGKSTQVQRFAHICRSHGLETLEVREPGGTAIGEQIRQILLDPRNTAMSLRCEMMLYMASRAQLIEERIRPALAGGMLVIADRFVSSTLAYQGTAGGLSLDDIRRVAAVALGEVRPDLFVVFDVDEQTAASRLNPLLDRMESKGVEFHRRVRAGFLEQAARDPECYVVLNARGTEDEVFARLLAEIEERFSHKTG